MQVHLTSGVQFQGNGAGLALVVEGNNLAVCFFLVHTGECTEFLTLSVENLDVVGATVTAENHGNSGLRTYEQVDLVVVILLECPTVLTVVPVVVARGIEGLVVGSVEEFVGQVEDILLMGASGLDLSRDSIKSDVASHDGLCGVFLTTGGHLEPAAYLRTFLSSSL